MFWCATRQVDKLNNENFFFPGTVYVPGYLCKFFSFCSWNSSGVSTPRFSLNSFCLCREQKKTGIEEAIETEKLKQALVEDENSIKKYFEMYAKADFDDEDTRNQVLEYFVDKIYVYNDRLVITWYYSDDKTSIDLDALTEITETSESNTVDRVSTLLQSDPYTFLPYVLP